MFYKGKSVVKAPQAKKNRGFRVQRRRRKIFGGILLKILPKIPDPLKPPPLVKSQIWDKGGGFMVRVRPDARFIHSLDFSKILYFYRFLF